MNTTNPSGPLINRLEVVLNVNFNGFDFEIGEI
jgi:hypothetical protein